MRCTSQLLQGPGQGPAGDDHPSEADPYQEEKEHEILYEVPGGSRCLGAGGVVQVGRVRPNQQTQVPEELEPVGHAPPRECRIRHPRSRLLSQGDVDGHLEGPAECAGLLVRPQSRPGRLCLGAEVADELLGGSGVLTDALNDPLVGGRTPCPGHHKSRVLECKSALNKGLEGLA